MVESGPECNGRRTRVLTTLRQGQRKSAFPVTLAHGVRLPAKLTAETVQYSKFDLKVFGACLAKD